MATVELSVVPVLASTTAACLARRFGPDQLAGVHSAIAALAANAYRLLPAQRRAVLDAAITIDMDCTDVQVYGPKRQGGGLHLRRATLRASAPGDLGRGGPEHGSGAAGRQRRRAAKAAALLGRALAGIPEQARTAAAGDRLRMRAYAGFFTAELAQAAVEHGC